MSARFVAAALVALATLTSAAACGASEEEGVDEIRVSGSVRDPAGAQITARVEQPGRTTVFSNEQITALPGNGVSTARVRTGRAGLMLVTVIVTTSPSDTIAAGELTFELNRGNLYSVSVFRQPAGRGYTCLGCSGYRAFPFRGSERATTDSLWLYYAARKPCRDCVY